MGGYGSGSRYGSARDTTADYRRLDVRSLQRDGLLAPGLSFDWRWSRNGEVIAFIQVRTEPGQVWLSYKHRRNDEPWQSEHYPVAVEWTPCHYGGQRAWFRCPTRACGRRVAILYGGGIFACRHCHQLAYQSQREPAWERDLSRAQAIKVKLGGEPGGDFPDKPKGMHWRTYMAFRKKAERAQAGSWPPWLLKTACKKRLA